MISCSHRLAWLLGLTALSPSPQRNYTHGPVSLLCPNAVMPVSLLMSIYSDRNKQNATLSPPPRTYNFNIRSVTAGASLASLLCASHYQPIGICLLDYKCWCGVREWKSLRPQACWAHASTPSPLQGTTPEGVSDTFKYIKTRHSFWSPAVKPGTLLGVLYLNLKTTLWGNLSW